MMPVYILEQSYTISNDSEYPENIEAVSSDGQIIMKGTIQTTIICQELLNQKKKKKAEDAVLYLSQTTVLMHQSPTQLFFCADNVFYTDNAYKSCLFKVCELEKSGFEIFY